MAEDLRKLEGPYELLDLDDGQTLETRIDTFERGHLTIHPRYAGAPSEKEIVALRIRVPFEYKPVGVPYYDITSKTLQAQLIPLLMARDFKNYLYIITKKGVRPRARFSLQRRPL